MIETGRGGPSPARPILLASPGESQPIQPTGRGSAKVRPPSRSRQGERLDRHFDDLLASFEVSEAMPDVDPELVVVLEVIDSAEDLESLSDKLEVEVILESEAEYELSEDFPRQKKDGSQSESQEPVGGTLHAVCSSRDAATRLVSLWRSWKSEETLPWGFGKLEAVFARLRDVRPWGPKDRLRVSGASDWLEGLLPDEPIPVVVELWFRANADVRAAAEARVRALVEAGGGTSLRAATVTDIGFHALAVRLPAASVQDLVAEQFDEVALIKASEVLYVRAGPQAIEQPSPANLAPDEDALTAPEAGGPPVVCLLDGVPTVNHRRLAGRVDLFDPDGLDADPTYTVDRRIHGTSMASLIVWGDLSDRLPAAARTLLVRPVLRPALDTLGGLEELPAEELAPDLMRRVFAELFEGVDGRPPAAPDVCVVNLSLGDPALPFDTMPSAWARALDWLSERYGVLVIVSAGNHAGLPVDAVEPLVREAGAARRRGVWQAVCAAAMARRLLSPAESMNALTVAALHADGSGAKPVGSAVDPADNEPMVSPVSALGRGHRRAVKPDIAAPGGRIFFVPPAGGLGVARRALPGAHGPGLAVAAPTPAAPSAGRRFEAGTSAATALVSRNAAALHEVLVELAPDLGRRAKATALKALLVHEARWDPALETAPIDGDRAIGFGGLARDLADGCAANEAVVLYVGEIGAGERQELRVPLPDGLAQKGVKRVTATLAWLSPINWRHRQYRKAKLSFSKPHGLVDVKHLKDCDGDVPANLRLSQRGTVQHHVYETTRASAAGSEDALVLRVDCVEQAGGLDGARVSYAVAMGLWCAPELGVAVYQQVRDQLQPRVRVAPES